MFFLIPFNAAKCGKMVIITLKNASKQFTNLISEVVCTKVQNKQKVSFAADYSFIFNHVYQLKIPKKLKIIPCQNQAHSK